ncbi:MAG: tRNA-dihydrouridine synthase family protein [Zetaproteobacteria bacterium]|nr:tRNA-dihydrouridine synthase family protein [Zetaproteobacteria bacterium]
MKRLPTHLPSLGLAPMEGVTEFPTRLWFSLLGHFDSMGTPFLRVTESFPHGDIPFAWAPELFDPTLHGRLPYTLTPQIMGIDPERLKEVGAKILQHSPLVELNCGCPSPTVYGKGAGSGLLTHPGEFGTLLQDLSHHLGHTQFAAKIRVGIHCPSEFGALLHELQHTSLARLSIHARTRQQKYTGQADWTLISQAAEVLDYPVWASGDILSMEDIRNKSQMFPKISGMLMGRGLLRNPWMLAQHSHMSLDQISTDLQIYAYMHLLYRLDLPQLIRFTTQEIYPHREAVSPERLAQICAKLQQVIHRYPQQPKAERQVLGRVKLLYNYLRSSLPADYFCPPILRAKSIGEFFQLLSTVTPTQHHAHIQLQVQTMYNWMYSGEARPK